MDNHRRNILLFSMQPDIDVIGLKYLHYHLMENGFSSHLCYLPLYKENDPLLLKHLETFISNIQPLFIGFSLMSTEFHPSCDLTRYLKKKFPSIPIIWGGSHPTVCPEMCLEVADYVCIGEGERSMLDFARALKNSEDVKDIPNLSYLDKGLLRKNSVYPIITNLDELPIVEHVPKASFIQEKRGAIVAIDKDVFRQYARYRGTTYSVMSSRGCPFTCTYCTNNFYSALYETRKIRRRSIENVIKEIEQAISDNPQIDYVNFQDDCFLAGGNDYIKQFCQTYKERIGKPFVLRAIPTYVTREKISLCMDAGLSWISLGLQSGSDYINKEVFKRNSLKKDFLRAAGIIKEFNVAAFYDVIIDNPFESEEDKLATIETFIETPKPFYPQIFSLSLFMGTELYERAKKEMPEKIEDALTKNFLIYKDTSLNVILKLSVYLSEKIIRKLISMYQQDPKSIKFKATLWFLNLISSMMFEPWNYFVLIRISQRGSFLKTIKVIRNFFKIGFMRYVVQLKLFIKNKNFKKKKMVKECSFD